MGLCGRCPGLLARPRASGCLPVFDSLLLPAITVVLPLQPISFLSPPQHVVPELLVHTDHLGLSGLSRPGLVLSRALRQCLPVCSCVHHSTTVSVLRGRPSLVPLLYLSCRVRLGPTRLPDQARPDPVLPVGCLSCSDPVSWSSLIFSGSGPSVLVLLRHVGPSGCSYLGLSWIEAVDLCFVYKESNRCGS